MNQTGRYRARLFGGNEACRERVHHAAGYPSGFNQHGVAGSAAAPWRIEALKLDIEADHGGAGTREPCDHARDKRVIQRAGAETTIGLGGSRDEDQ
jgi:hypothetical protein